MGRSIAKLSVDMQTLLATTDVGGVRFEASRVSCGGETFEPAVIVSDSNIEDLVVPVENPTFADKPLGSGSQHLFADKFMVLPPGCYDITVTPIQKTGSPSVDCAAARRSNVQIFANATTEIVLVNQCRGANAGSLDTVAALNFPPSLQDLTFEPSRFGDRCQPQRVCITAKDPDHDPLQLTWTGSAEQTLAFAGPRIASTTTLANGATKQCVDIMPQAAGEYTFRVAAYDLLGRSDLVETRIEDWLAASGTSAASHASVTFAFHASTNGREPAAEVCDGTDNDCDFEVDEAVCVGTLKSLYQVGDTSPNDNQIAPFIRIKNDTAETIPLEQLKLRYYYTTDGNAEELVTCASASANCANVTTRITGSGANRYIEIGFAPGAGTLPASATTDVSLILTKDRGNYNESNDFSYDASKTSFAEWSRVPIYRSGLRVFGEER